jgi:hypothetical protein
VDRFSDTSQKNKDKETKQISLFLDQEESWKPGQCQPGYEINKHS